jgi:hypothetical protein
MRDGSFGVAHERWISGEIKCGRGALGENSPFRMERSQIG